MIILKSIALRKKISISQYRIRLEEKQKLRFHYGLTERQLLKYVRIAGKAKWSTGLVLLQLLEMRLRYWSSWPRLIPFLSSYPT